MRHQSITVNPQKSPQGLICKKEFLGEGLFGGRAYSKGTLFQTWHFPKKVDIKSDKIYSINLIKKLSKCYFT